MLRVTTTVGLQASHQHSCTMSVESILTGLHLLVIMLVRLAPVPAFTLENQIANDLPLLTLRLLRSPTTLGG